MQGHKPRQRWRNMHQLVSYTHPQPELRRAALMAHDVTKNTRHPAPNSERCWMNGRSSTKASQGRVGMFHKVRYVLHRPCWCKIDSFSQFTFGPSFRATCRFDCRACITFYAVSELARTRAEGLESFWGEWDIQRQQGTSSTFKIVSSIFMRAWMRVWSCALCCVELWTREYLYGRPGRVPCGRFAPRAQAG